jgi:long-chain acyl-CoA synthetase
VEVTRLFDLLDHTKEKYQDKFVLAHKEKGQWKTFNIEEYIQESNFVSYGLLAKGIKKGDVIATVSNNRVEWNFLDMGISQIGGIHLAIYPTISTEEYEYILCHAKPKFIFVSDKSLYSKIQPIANKVEEIEMVYTINEVSETPNWQEIVNLGKDNEYKFKELLGKIKENIHPDDVAAITYTSGTTGSPKGVMISHNNYLSNAIATSYVHGTKAGSRTLSFLPLSHVYERMLNYHFQYKGIAIYYAENLGTISENLNEISPEIFTSVPRVLELTYNKILAKGKELPWLQKKIFFWAVNLGYRYADDLKNSFLYRIQLAIARKLIFSKWKAALGGKLNIVVSGGASLQTKIARIFWAAGVHVLEGYGLTETSPVIAVANLSRREIKLGTVGPILDGVQVKFANDGELLCKGPNIMKGYYKQPELTAEVIDSEGWFHTGDIAILEDGKYLRITDRKKEIFKLNNGKYVAPQSIENKLKESFFIEQAMVIGENEKFASAIITPDYSFLYTWCSEHLVEYKNNAELINQSEVILCYQKEVNRINKTLGAAEQIKRFRLVTDEWTPQSGELSPTLKLKRRIIMAKYKDIIEQIYSIDNSIEN